MPLLHRARALPNNSSSNAKRRRAAALSSPSRQSLRRLLLPPRPSSSNQSSSSSWLSYPPSKAALLTGAYALAAGAALVAAPQQTLAVLAPRAAEALPPGWIRLGGMILATFGAQYALASWFDRTTTPKRSADAFYAASIPSRLALAVGIAALVATGQVEKGVLVLAVLNATGALSMLRALRRPAAVAGDER